MSLDDFLEECRRTGATPISYESRSDSLLGNRYERWENPAYKNRAFDSLKTLLDENTKDGDLFNMMYGGEDIFIHNQHGYHYGRLVGFDGKRFYLEGYCFSDRLMDEISYIEKTADSPGGYKVAIPADNLISVGEIPSVMPPFVEEFAYD